MSSVDVRVEWVAPALMPPATQTIKISVRWDAWSHIGGKVAQSEMHKESRTVEPL
jgi:hypothetical protein